MINSSCELAGRLKSAGEATRDREATTCCYAKGNIALALVANTIAAGAALILPIAIFGPISGAHFNPAVTLYLTLTGDLRIATALSYTATRIVCAVLGVYPAHAMFGSAIFEVSHKLREAPGQSL